MRTVLASFALAGFLAALGEAQIRNEIVQHDGTADFVGRGNVAESNDGYAVERWRVGAHLGGLKDINQFTVVVQDDNCSTSETWQLGIFGEYMDPVTGAGTGTPDENNGIVGTAFFPSPACGGGTPNVPNAWIYDLTIPTPLAGPFQSDLFTAVYLPINSNGNNDGTYATMSVAPPVPAAAGVNPEYPNLAVNTNSYPPAQPGEFPGAAYGCTFDVISGARMATEYPANWRVWYHSLWTSHSTLVAGSNDTTGSLYASAMAVGPNNFGMAGCFPDATDQSATSPQRRDAPVYRATHLVPTGLTTILIGSSLARQTLGTPVDFGTIGMLELDPTDVLFQSSIGGLSQALGLQAAILGAQTDILFNVDALGLRFYLSPQVTLYGQALDIELASGQIHLSNMFEANYL